ncbi:MAG: hypothetical protein WC956_03305 [bacterium]
MILKWVQSMTGAGRAEPAEQAAGEEGKAKQKRESKLIDVAHEALRLDRESLDGLVRIGVPNAQREKIKGKVRKKIWDAVSEGFDAVDGDMVEEITERVVDAAENDPVYKKMFDLEDVER